MKRMLVNDLFLVEEAQDAYREGEEAVVKLGKRLMALIQEQAARIQELEARFNKGSPTLASHRRLMG